MISYSKHLFTLITCLVVYCSYGQDKDPNTVWFIQGNTKYEVNQSSAVIELERKPFAIRYFCQPYNSKKEQFYSLKASVVADATDTLSTKTGERTDAYPPYGPGTGWACADPCNEVIVKSEGHNYIFYENESDKRANLISKHKKLLELEWPILSAFYDKKDYRFADLPVNALYFMLFIDRNLNKVIDADELKIITVKFK